jgi:hypothetical protein
MVFLFQIWKENELLPMELAYTENVSSHSANELLPNAYHHAMPENEKKKNEHIQYACEQ